VNFRDTFGLAQRNLRQAKLRTALTTLGVSIGIASLSGMVSLGVGLQEQFVGRFMRSGMFDTISVLSPRERLGAFARVAAGAPTQRAGKTAAELDDEALARIAALEGVREAYPNLRAPAQIRHDQTTEFTSVAGVPLSARELGIFQKITFGSFFANESDDACLLTLDFADRLTNGNPAILIGRELTLVYAALKPSASSDLSIARGERKFRVGGILEREPGPMLGGGLAPVMVPLAKAREFGSYDVSDPRALFDQFSSRRSYFTATVRVARPQDTEDVQRKIKEMGFTTFSVTDALQGAKRAFIILDILLGLVGSIALVVASLGIVNTMVMSILERTREIGVMKAVGAADRDVRSIFLVEASTIGLAGGVTGMALGWTVGQAINFGANLYIERQGGSTGNLFSIPWWLVLGGLAFSIAVSLVAGSYPASRAARLDPIRALRHD
jgi:putative ABC transport system permease protein